MGSMKNTEKNCHECGAKLEVNVNWYAAFMKAHSNICKECYRSKGRERYKNNREKIINWYKDNKEKIKERRRNQYRNNPEKKRERDRKWRESNKDRVREYGWRHQGINITYREYEKMYEEQGGKCLFCGKEFKVLAVDHNHNTGEIRGLLCLRCNLKIEAYENVDVRNNIIKYLEGVR